jgi:hypothetical protein
MCVFFNLCTYLHQNRRLKRVIKRRKEGREDKEEDVSSYWMTLRKENILKLERGSTWS